MLEDKLTEDILELVPFEVPESFIKERTKEKLDKFLCLRTSESSFKEAIHDYYNGKLGKIEFNHDEVNENLSNTNEKDDVYLDKSIINKKEHKEIIDEINKISELENLNAYYLEPDEF